VSEAGQETEGRTAAGSGGRLRELAALFGKLGVIGFGGPAAHIAMMEDEVVRRRGWLTREHFLDLVGATNLIPGPNSTEMTMHVGYERAGWRGLFVAGGSFILPAVTITTILSWFYVEYGSLPAVEPWLRGIEPAVIAIILGALWKLGKKAVKGWRLAVIGLAVAAVVLAGTSVSIANAIDRDISECRCDVASSVRGHFCGIDITRGITHPRDRRGFTRSRGCRRETSGRFGGRARRSSLSRIGARRSTRIRGGSSEYTTRQAKSFGKNNLTEFGRRVVCPRRLRKRSPR
jgi:chromate transport protein ChrA